MKMTRDRRSIANTPEAIDSRTSPGETVEGFAVVITSPVPARLFFRKLMVYLISSKRCSTAGHQNFRRLFYSQAIGLF
jgi:hypothetical protein